MKAFSILPLLLFSLNCFSQVELSKGLIAYYPFSGNANNSVNNELHGTLNGNIQLTTDRFGNENSAYHFNGTNSNIIIKDQGVLSNPAFSICYYFKTEKKGLQVILGKINFEDGNGATFNSGVFYGGDNSFFGTMQSIENCFAQVPTTFVYTIQSPPVIELNEWNCVVNTFEKGIERLYLNGMLVKEESLPFINATYCSNTDLVIGSWWKGDPNWFKGVIDDVRIYNRAITQDEVRALCLPKKDSLIINSYSKVLELNTCESQLQLKDATSFNTGDTVLLIQMKGALIDTSNTPSFGKILDFQNAGNYEINVIRQKNGNKISLKNQIERQYDFTGTVQLVRIPSFGNFSFDDVLTCKPWDGETGGVLAFFAETVDMNADIDVTGKGFRSGKPMESTSVFSNQIQYYYEDPENEAAQKGEGISTLSSRKNYGRGPAGNGGGGGNAHNGGGGGGGNGGAGGLGGRQFEEFPFAENIGGLGGNAIKYNNTENKIFMGGAGGMGNANNLFEYTAGHGGGIILIIAKELKSNGFVIKADGGNGVEPDDPETSTDGMPGGGAGGTIILDIDAAHDKIKVSAAGGKGANNIANLVKHAPGGGGGGGVALLAKNNLSDYQFNLSGGKGGVEPYYNNDPYGATNGEAGKAFRSFQPHITSIPFKKGIESVAIREAVSNCNHFYFEGSAETTSPAALKWQWKFGDGGRSNSQNVNYTYQNTQNLNTVLVVEDEFGCKDSATVLSQLSSLELKAVEEISACKGTNIQLTVNGADVYSWAPATGLNDPAIANPTLTVQKSLIYTVSGKNDLGCTGSAKVNISVLSAPQITISNDTLVCKNNPITLKATGGTSYSWFPNTGLSNAAIAQPIATPNNTTQYIVTVTNDNNCTAKDSMLISVKEASIFSINADTSICAGDEITLWVSGGSTYSWSPSAYLNQTNIPDPVATVTETTTYSVNIADDVCGETAMLSTTITALPLPQVRAQSSNDITCSAPSARLSAQGAVSYNWYPDEGLSSAGIENPVATPKVSTLYTVTGTDLNGCMNSDSIFVRFTNVSNNLYELPNSFTPNGDGLNDCLGTKHWGFLESLDFQIFNRWGQRVFHATSSSQCWDGTFKGENQPNGAYVYILEAKTYCETIERKGTIYLIR